MEQQEPVEPGQYPEQGRTWAEHLLEEWDKIEQEYSETLADWERVTPDGSGELRGYIEQHQSKLQRFHQQLSGWRQKQKTLEESEQQLKSEREEFRQELLEFDDDWAENPQELEEVNTDLVDRDRVVDRANQVETTREDLRRLREEHRDVRAQIEQFELPEEEPVDSRDYTLPLAFASGFVSMVGLLC